MHSISELFDWMDQWRHFPSYQLERRADLFFALYLPEVLKARLGFPVRGELIPEFPVRIGTIRKGGDNKSYKIDYVALAATGDKAVFVELKTEGLSRRSAQDRYLSEAREAGFPALLTGLVDLFRKSDAKKKYFRLLEYLESLDLLQIPAEMKQLMQGEDLRGVDKASRGVRITTRVKECLVVYVQPVSHQADEISFHEFAEIVRRHDDPLSQRFAKSLREWATLRAGERL